METRTFRQPSCVVFAGGFIALIGGAISGVASYHFATGIPLLQGDSKLHAGEHIAGSNELLMGILGGLPFLILGLVLILVTVNCAVTIDARGISATNFLRHAFFHAAWLEITALDRIDSNPGSGYKLSANGKTLKIQTSTVDMKELIAEIQRHSPNLPKTMGG